MAPVATSMDKQPAEEDVHEESQESEISMLTMEGVENYSYSRKNHHHSSITTMIMSTSSSLPPASTTTASTESSSTISATTTLPYGGRPKGTTAVASSIMAEKVKECISNSAAEYMRVREEEKEKGGGESRVKRNTLACIILREKEALGIPPAVNINFETVRTRAKRKNNQGTNTARISPMLEVEPYIVELIDQLGKMRPPITCREGATATCKFTSWEKSFARLRTNKKAVAERGWGPLNYNCLLNPEIQLTKFGVVPLN